MTYWRAVVITNFAGDRFVGVTTPDQARSEPAELFVTTRERAIDYIDFWFQSDVGTFTLAAPAIFNDNRITVNPGHSVVAGQYIILRYNEQVSQFKVLSVTVNTFIVDSPIEFAYPIGTPGENGSISLNVDGSVTPQIFYVRPNPDIIWDIAQIVFVIQTASVPYGNEFGDIAGGLVRGVAVQTRGDDNRNLYNIKRNADFASYGHVLNYDLEKLPADPNFVRAVRHFDGANRLGPLLRLCGTTTPLDELRIVIQDNLTGLGDMKASVQGFITSDECEE